jgi:hypothetical protein
MILSPGAAASHLQHIYAEGNSIKHRVWQNSIIVKCHVTLTNFLIRQRVMRFV